MQTSVRQIALIAAITEEINAGKTLEEILDIVYAKLRNLIPYHRIGVALVNGRADVIKLVALKSDSKPLLGIGYSGKLKGSTLAPIFKTGQPRIINNLEDYLRKKPESASTRLIVQEGMRSSLTLPLVVRGNPVGVIFFSSRKADEYRDEHVSFLKLLSGHVAICVEKTHLLHELREKSDFLENVLSNSADAIVIVDSNGIIQSWNKGAEQIFGYSKSEAIGKDTSFFAPPELVATGEVEKFQQMVLTQGFVTGYETLAMTRDGRRITVSATSNVLKDSSGRVIGRCSILRDLTALKRLQEQLAEAQSLAAIGELAASVAHEIKNPLAGISGAVQILSRSFREDDTRRKVADDLLHQVKRLDNTVRDLLIFARPWKPQARSFNLCLFLDSVLSRTETIEAAAGLRIVRDMPARCMLRADPQLLEHVLVNVVQNAVDAVGGKGSITVRVMEEDSVARIEIADTGVGIPPQHRNRLFKPFFSTKSKGTGLGLAISKKIVDMHRGTITVDSEPGKGTVVRIVLPRDFEDR